MLPSVSRRRSFGPGRFGGRPVARPISRPGLMARLDAADGMVVLAGGPGAGKSTLLDAWVAARGGVLAGLDGHDPREWADVLAQDGVVALDGVTAADEPGL